MIIATNVRFDKNEYQDLKMLALANGKSTASLIREAVRKFTIEKMMVKERLSLAERMTKNAIKLDIPIRELVVMGRRFE